jgi:hypothetical protein
MMRPNKLKCLSLETLSCQVLEFVDKARANPLEDLSDAFFSGKLLVLPANVKLDWKVIVRYKHKSLFGCVISNEAKKFYNIGRIFSHVRPSYEQAVGDLDRSMNISLWI